MKMPARIERSMLAPCGMNCMVCYKHCASPKPCAGCRANSVGKPAHCQNCRILECAATKSVTFCAECSAFPCKLLRGLERSYRRCHISLIANGVAARDEAAAFLEAERLRWTCPECGGVVSLHDGICGECAAPHRPKPA